MPGDGPEFVEAAEPVISVAVHHSVHWARGTGLATGLTARFTHHGRVDASLPGVRVTLPAARVTFERTWIEWGDVDPMLQLGVGDVEAWANRRMGGLRSPTRLRGAARPRAVEGTVA